MSPEGDALASFSECSIAIPATPSSWAVAVELIDEYARSLDIDLAFQDLHKEIADPAAQYSPPDGAFYLAKLGESPVGCAALRRFDATTGELKRLYVRPVARGKGLGRVMAERVIEAAVGAGYSHLVLDTLPSMASAQALYRSLGFVEVPAYRYNPVPGAVYMRLDLADRVTLRRNAP
jgi:putative acetyltransferase